MLIHDIGAGRDEYLDLTQLPPRSYEEPESEADRQLTRKLRALLDAAHQAGLEQQLDPELVEQLKSLGYLD